MIGYVEKIIEEKKCFERSYSEALILAAKKIKKSEIRNEIHQKIISSLKVGELPEFLVKSSGKGDKLSLRSISSFRASLSMRSRKRQLSTILPEWILDDKVRSYAFVDKLGIDRPLIFNSHIKFSEIDKGEKIVIKPVSGAGSRGVYLVENSDNILDVRNSKLLGGWKSLEFSIRNDLKNGLVKNDDWIVEELIYNENSLEKPSRDIKFYCFYGKVALILEVRRYPSKGYCWWSASGELVNTGKYDDKVIQGDGVSKKEIDLAAAMSSEIPAPFVRLDFHKSSERLVFGEFTPRPGNYEKFDEKTDQLLGDYFLEAEGRLMDDLIGGKKFEYFNQFLNEIDINS
ncbi:teichuronopeptide biosynthesis [Halalkalibacter wakoensis JCM 9140]|uniref:Teichuronopeptide biosynthesis n=1 Tax=Halalkalibacter wakoensis JCM 9140 TaxID=1236970 RepID=W4Q4H1_9BACI|nr:ATP-grasp fold amidoligase family protein [Halalkalibacter wakoensis]GAE26264.1 teichuronopeptide biosynthesis [Halalkalibacter wakoensis JCM 9140]